jgi:predicted nucleic acid-binding protein
MSADAPTAAVYLDSSAIVKLVVREPETEALLAFLEPRQLRVTSALARVEVLRAVRDHGRSATPRATAMLDALSQLALDDALLDSAAAIDANQLRSLHAIHLASVRQLEGELDVLVTYDERMLAVARALGIPVSVPA